MTDGSTVGWQRGPSLPDAYGRRRRRVRPGPDADRRAPRGDAFELVAEDPRTGVRPLHDEIRLLTALAAAGVDAVPAVVASVERESARVAILDVAAGPTLAQLLGSGRVLEPGGLVTLLASVADVLGEAHSRGEGHGAIRADVIRFDARGRPEVQEWGHAPPPAAARADDWAAFERLALDTAEACDIALPAGVRRALGAVRAASVATPHRAVDDDVGRLAHALVDALFEWTPAAPVLPGRERTGSVTATRRRPVRPVFVALAVGAVACIVAVGVLVLGAVHADGSSGTGGTGGGAASVAPVGTTSPDAATSVAADAASAAPAPVDPVPVDPVPVDPVPVELGPVEAATRLLTDRAECLRRDDPSCLVALYEPDAPGLEADLARSGAVDAAGDAGAPVPGTVALEADDGHIAVVVYDVRVGDTTQPASAALVRGEAGWVVREVRDAVG